MEHLKTSAAQQIKAMRTMGMNAEGRKNVVYNWCVNKYIGTTSKQLFPVQSSTKIFIGPLLFQFCVGFH